MKHIYMAALAAFNLLCLSNSLTYAHATLENGEAVSGSSYKAVIRIAHGCSGSPTLSLKVKIPDGMINVKPMPKSGWTLATVKAPYTQPYENHGKMISEGVSEITWSGGKLFDEHYDEFVFRGSVSSRVLAGKTLYVPVTQDCEAGQAAWVETPTEGADYKSLKFPAPFIKVTAIKNTAIVKIGDLAITQPWSREVPSGAKTAGGYMTIKNEGTVSDKLISVETPYASSTEIHEMSNANNIMTMRKLETGLEIKPGETVAFISGSYHIMFVGVKTPAKAGSRFPATFTFEKAGRVDVNFNVQALNASQQQTNMTEEHKH